jgi:hypothetical protein
MDYLKYVRQSLFFFKQNFFTIVAIQLPFLLLLALLSEFFPLNVEDTQTLQKNFFLLQIINFALLPVYHAATIEFINSVVNGQRLSPFQAVYKGLGRWRALFITYLLMTMATSLGMLFLIVPGIFVAIRLSFADYICVIEGRSAMKSLKQSWEETEMYFWPLLGGLGILYGGYIFLSYTSEMLFSGLPYTLELLFMAVVNLCSTVITIFGFRMYSVMCNETRKPKELPAESAQLDEDDTQEDDRKDD